VTPIECRHCRTELPPDALACPACGTLIHADRLRVLKTDADAAAQRGDLEVAREHWTSVLALLPARSRQHIIVSDKIADLTRDIEAASGTAAPGKSGTPQRRLGPAAVIVTAILLLLGKLKFLLLGLTKASTFVSMFAFLGVYWSVYGWPLALGLVLSIYIHEMGHVSMLRRLGIHAGAPLFIPGVGAMVMLKQRITNPIDDAKIGLAGPVWGLGAALVALAIYIITGASIWRAIAQLTAFLNLFNLTPVWQLDGSRGFHALTRSQRYAVVGVIAVALLLSAQRLLFIVGGVAVWRALQRDVGPGDRRTLVTFVMLIIALSLLARDVG
jgi:Zn-dependent protease